jgi:hypothetical protein
VQTFGDLANFNPHVRMCLPPTLHSIQTECSLPPVPEVLVAEGFRRAVLAFSCRSGRFPKHYAVACSARLQRVMGNQARVDAARFPVKLIGLAAAWPATMNTPTRTIGSGIRIIAPQSTVLDHRGLKPEQDSG